MEHYAEFSRRWFEGSEDIARYETLVVLDRVKVGLSLPVLTKESAPRPPLTRCKPKGM
jgi:hypothetical protein